MVHRKNVFVLRLTLIHLAVMVDKKTSKLSLEENTI